MTVQSSRAPLDPATLVRHVKPGPRYTSYPPATEFGPAFATEHARQALAQVGRSGGSISLYCHIPFCKSLCWYCGCNVVVSRKRDRGTDYISRVAAELAMVGDALGARLPLAELSLGGGSPNFLRETDLTRLVDAIHRHFSPTDDAEFGIELDPRTTTPEQIQTLATAGFRRVSVGVQDFNQATQEAINRFQSVEQTAAVLDRARALGVTTTNVDLVYGLPGQTETSLAETLDAVITMAPSRVALFGYAHLPDRLPHQKLVERKHSVPGSELRARLLQTALERLDGAGYRRIGLDHFALPDDALAQAADSDTLHRNFQGYVVRRADHLLGVGSSAISDTGAAYWQNESRIDLWTQLIDAGELPVARGLQLSDDDRLRRDVIMELMCHGAVAFADIEANHDIEFESYFASELDRLTRDDLVELCAVNRSNRRVSTSEAGRLLVRNVAMVFDTYLAARLAAASGQKFSSSL